MDDTMSHVHDEFNLTPEKPVYNGELQAHTETHKEHASHVQPILSNCQPRLVLILPLHISPLPT